MDDGNAVDRLRIRIQRIDDEKSRIRGVVRRRVAELNVKKKELRTMLGHELYKLLDKQPKGE